MSRLPGGRAQTKDMYWFAHGGIETNSDKCLTQRSTTPGEGDEESSDSSSPTWKSLSDRKGLPDDQKSPKDNAYSAATDGGNSLGPTSERDDRLRMSDKRMAVEERKKQLWEAEQERHDAVMRKHMEREAALEARRNAQRSNISFAFGSSVPRNVETLQAGDSEKVNRQYGASSLQHKEENYEKHHERRSVSPFNYSGHSFLIDSISPHSISSQSCVYSERQSISPSCWLVGSGALIGDDTMSRSMTAAVPAPRGRRKNDLMPTVPYDRTATPTTSKNSTSSTRKRSVSMTRLDQLAQPRRHYVEATKASSTASSGGASSMIKDNFRSPTRPLSSASEQSGGSGRVSGYVNRRVRSSPRKPRPVSIAGTVPDQKSSSDAKVSPTKRSYTPAKKTAVVEVKKSVVNAKTSPSKPAEKTKPVDKTKSAPRTSSTPKATKQLAAPKLQAVKQQSAAKTSTPKVPAAKKSSTNKKKSDILVASTAAPEETENQSLDIKPSSPPSSPPPDNSNAEAEKNAKRIISEEEAKAALAEKRRLAREQAEREAELERQRQEELRLEEEERMRKEEEEQKRMEEETLHLLEEHRRQEEEKLKKAIEEQERKEEEERAKREEELRVKAEQERKAHEEAEKQRIELEEKLRKEEEERAERKKRLEKIMSRTRGKTSGSSPSGSVSSDQLDSGENPQDGFSSGANSLDSNEAGDIASGPASVEGKTESLSVGNSLEANPTYEIVSGNESLNSNDIVMPSSETASQDNSMVIIPDDTAVHASATDISVADVQKPVPSDSQIEPPSNSESSVSHDENVLSESVPVKDSFLNDEYLDNQNDKAGLDMSEIPSTLTESVYQPISEENQYHGTIESSELNEKTSTEDFSHVESSMQLETSVIDNSKPVAASDVVLSFNEGSDNQMSAFISSENSNAINTDALDYVLAQTSENLKLEDTMLGSPLTLEQVGSEEAEIIESNSRNSISSDMKLPDPIYETTSDEGSVSSEKHNQDFNAYMLQDRNLENSNQEPVPMSDDVFSEQEPAYKNPDLTYQVSNPFSEKEEIPIVTDDLYAEQFHTEQSKSMLEHENYEKSIICVDSFQLQQNDSSQAGIAEGPFVVDNDGNKENIEAHDFGNPPLSTVNNPFACEENQKLNEFDIYADKENVQFTSSNVEDYNESVHEMHKTCSDQIMYLQDGINPFLQQSSFSSNSEINVLQHQDYVDLCNIQENELVISDPVHDLKSQTLVDEPCEFSSEGNDVTIIKAEGSEDCIGIISSVDHDQISNDFPKQNLLNEHLKSNFEYASMTDSEDSSLDSNLSQVITVETSEKELMGGLTHTQKLSESEIIKPVSNNVEQTEHPFNIQHTYNGDSISKSNGNHFCASEIISNGHRMETSDQISDQISEFHEYVQIGGNDISSVDHSKTNIFENVDAIDFSKVSPDPFLAKGNSNQISGNPFLLQDDQKQVLVTPDFLN